MYFVDSHTHLYARQLKNDLEEVIQRAIDAGVRKMYLPNIDSESIEPMLELEAKYPEHCFPMMGLHPCSVKEDFEKELYQVEEWLGKRKFAAVGEMGTDLYWDKTHFEQQKEAFRIQVELAKKHQLPIVIHCRNSFNETIELLTPLKDGHLKGIFHCFTGTMKDALKVVELDFLMGIGGVVTFKNGGLDKILPEIDLKQLVLETDSPYLAPVPFRGKRNETSYLPLVAEKIAEIKNISLNEVALKTSQNAEELFSVCN